MNYSSTAPSTPKEQTSAMPFLSNPAYQNCPPITEADILEADHRIAALDAQFQADQAAAAEMRALREEPPKERMQIVRSAIEAWQPRLVVIDGIADLQHNTNDLEESERIITELMALSTHHRCHILCVLHTNPNSDKARGHVGSGLQRKAETVLYVHRTGECSVVEPQFCRNEPFERFAFSIDNEGFELGLPVPATPPREREGEDQNIVVRLLQELYGGCIERTILTGKLMERLGVGRPAAGMRISRAIEQGKVLQSGKHVRLAHLPITADPAEADSGATTGTSGVAEATTRRATGVAPTAAGIAAGTVATAPTPPTAAGIAPAAAPAMADDDDVPF